MKRIDKLLAIIASTHIEAIREDGNLEGQETIEITTEELKAALKEAFETGIEIGRG